MELEGKRPHGDESTLAKHPPRSLYPLFVRDASGYTEMKAQWPNILRARCTPGVDVVVVMLLSFMSVYVDGGGVDVDAVP